MKKYLLLMLSAVIFGGLTFASDLQSTASDEPIELLGELEKLDQINQLFTVSALNLPPRKIGKRPVIVESLIVNQDLTVDGEVVTGTVVLEGISTEGDTIDLDKDISVNGGITANGGVTANGDLIITNNSNDASIYVNNIRAVDEVLGISLDGNNIKAELPILFDGPDSAQDIIDTRSNLGLGTAATKNEEYFVKKIEEGDLTITNGNIFVVPPTPTDAYNEIYLAPNGDEGAGGPALSRPMIGLALDEFKHAAITVDTLNDPNPTDTPTEWNSLARIINAAGTTAMIYDEANVTITKVVVAPTDITDPGVNGDIAHVENLGTNYWALYIGDRWTWIEVNTNAFPW